MKRYLLLIMMSVLVSVGTWAATISGTDISGGTAGYDPKVQTLVVSKPGALATWVANHTGDKYDTNNPFEGLGGSDNFYALAISGELNADDLAALNSTTCAAFSRFPRIDMSGVTLASGATKADVFAVNFGAGSFDKNGTTISGDGATYIRLPNDMTSEDDVKEMAKMKQSGKNANLKMVGAYDPDNSEFDDSSKKWAEVAMHSFEANKVPEFLSFMNMPTSGNPTVVPRDIKMSGEYGDQDLVGSGGPNFGHGTSAKWDFTGAHFADCTDAEATQNAAYYNYDDPFCDGEKVKCPTTTNAFFYFKQYKNAAVDVKLPDNNMTHLPFRCLNDLGSLNKSGYVALYGEAAFENNKAEANCVPIESLTIPDCYTDLDEECGKWARIRHLVIGRNVKRVHGGAFLKCDYLEDLDFGAGLSDCWLGDQAFTECTSMKHIALSEGVVSLGASCFNNSQHIESIRLPQTLRYMGNQAMALNLALNSITIPENVEKIGKNCFYRCPFTDIYLTTTDPAKIPIVWSAGTWASQTETPFDSECTFNHGHVDGWEGGVDGYKDDIDGKMTFDEAADFYFANWNGLPVLHYPEALHDAVRGSISSTYAMTSKDGYGLPLRQDMFKRFNIPGAELGTPGHGTWTRDGWAQLLLMKEYKTDPGESEIYTKKYDDVWYTMCFPFDLSDEQLAGAFNETFNIVDFSGVEIKEPTETTGKKLVLHFNNVAITYYKDVDGNIYNRAGREEDGNYSYNIYTDSEGHQYHHVTTSDMLAGNKTKTFVRGTSLSDSKENYKKGTYPAILIDGILAEAGHPYMIHPAIGVNDGGTTKKNCTFSGISWLKRSDWAPTFEAKKRVINLGVAMGTIDESDPKNSTPDENNFLQAAYSKYKDQTYTFIGNAKEYRDDIPDDVGDEPLIPEKPVRQTKPETAPTEPTEAEMTEAPTVVANPDMNTKYTEDFKELFKTVRVSYTAWDGNKDATFTYTFGEDLVTYDYAEFFIKQDWVDNVYGPWYIYNMTRSNGHNVNKDGDKTLSFDMTPLVNYLGEGPLNSIDGFNELKQLAQDYTNDKEAYAQYQIAFAAYTSNKAAWAAYRAAKEEYDNWDQDAKDREYQDALNAYNDAVSAHDTWVENAKKWLTYIPKNAYFLGRKTGQLPKYYREVAENPAEGQASTRKGGVWTQFTAIVIPNDAAVAGIESELDGKTAQSKGFDMAFDEGFLGEVISEDEAVTLIENAQEEGAKVEYMDIVVSINGQVVRRGSTSLEGLPKGIYIINGKKYFVK